MALETAADEQAVVAEPEKKKEDIGSGEIGPIGRACEIFMLLAFPTTAYFIYTDDFDLQKQFLFIGLYVILALLGGVITNVKPAIPSGAK